MSQMFIPANEAEAYEMLEVPGRVACAGATNLYVDRQKGKYKDLDIVSLHHLDQLKKMTYQSDGWHIGSLAVFNEIERQFAGCGAMDALSAAASQIGGPQIRNRGTVGGNIISASPAADTVPVLMALDAKLVLKNSHGQRIVPINGFMKGPGSTDIRDGELLTEIIISDKKGEAAFRKVGKRNALAISIVNVAVYMETEEANISELAVAVGSAGPAAVRAEHVEVLLKNSKRPVSEAEWKQLGERIRETIVQDIHPIDDIRATASYRTLVASNVVLQLVRQLWEEKA